MVAGRRPDQSVPNDISRRRGRGTVALGLRLSRRRRRRTSVVHDVALGVRQCRDTGSGFTADRRHGMTVTMAGND